MPVESRPEEVVWIVPRRQAVGGESATGLRATDPHSSPAGLAHQTRRGACSKSFDLGTYRKRATFRFRFRVWPFA